MFHAFLLYVHRAGPTCPLFLLHQHSLRFVGWDSAKTFVYYYLFLYLKVVVLKTHKSQQQMEVHYDSKGSKNNKRLQNSYMEQA
jgi:hypothetical protein